MKQQLVRLLFPYGSKRRVLRGPARGMQFIVEPGIGFTYALGTEAAAPRCFQDWIRLGMTVYDVGANKGQMALLFAALVGPSGRVVSLEPAPAEFANCQRNIELNPLANVRALQAAAAESAGEILFTYYDTQPTQGKFEEIAKIYGENNAANTFPVRTLPLDDLLGDEPPPDVIKIDVEGAAGSVLRGARRILSEVGPGIYLELHGPDEQAAVKDELFSHGYIAQTLDGKRVTDPTDGWHSPLWCYKAAA